MAMVRKQLYIDGAQDEKLKRFAMAWGVSEAQVVRRAIDELLEYDLAQLDDLRQIAEPAAVAYGGTMEESRERKREGWQNRRLDHDAWLEELAFIQERARQLGGQGGGSADRFNREEMYDKRRMRLPD
jgi:hypothetical protein